METKKSSGKVRQILHLVKETFYWLPWNNIKAILGPLRGFFPPYAPYSEFNILKIHDRDSFQQFLRFLADTSFFWYKANRGETIDIQPERVETHDIKSRFAVAEAVVNSENPTSFATKSGMDFKEEAWIYINGIVTDRHVAMTNGEYLSHLFGRNIQIIHNPTDALLFDLIECVASRIWSAFSVADQFAYDILLSRLKEENIKRVVLIAHSQGTIITANILRKLQETHLDLLWKLEIYTMANCSNLMEQKKDSQGRLVPYLEHFANTQDLICRLGVLAHAAQKRGEVRIDGPVFIRKAWGHLLNAHYLVGVEKQEYQDSQGAIKSRLYEYFDGESPV